MRAERTSLTSYISSWFLIGVGGCFLCTYTRVIFRRGEDFEPFLCLFLDVLFSLFPGDIVDLVSVFWFGVEKHFSFFCTRFNGLVYQKSVYLSTQQFVYWYKIKNIKYNNLCVYMQSNWDVDIIKTYKCIDRINHNNTRELHYKTKSKNEKT